MGQPDFQVVVSGLRFVVFPGRVRGFGFEMVGLGWIRQNFHRQLPSSRPVSFSTECRKSLLTSAAVQISI